jgi:hypothetical protein
MICTLNHMWLYKEIYTFVCFWFLGLLFASILNVVGRFSTVFCFRGRCLQLSDLAPNCNLVVIESLMRNSSIGDYLILSLLGSGLRKEEFAQVMEGLSSTMKQKEEDLANDGLYE